MDAPPMIVWEELELLTPSRLRELARRLVARIWLGRAGSAVGAGARPATSSDAPDDYPAEAAGVPDCSARCRRVE
ncbi:MAG: hypothetical protein HY329_25785 [Chloroflexi bacterium]|nr:hypothetical protein [Chloroflexota bacterium]